MHLDFRSSGTAIAIAIVIGAGLVSAALYFTQNNVGVSADQVTIQRLSPDDRHVYGSPSAPTIIVEFSDFQCPFCARVHPTIKQLVDESEGMIAWEYRHLPLDSHELALPMALVSECLAENYEEDTFWQFTNDIFNQQGALTPALIAQKGTEYGLSEEELDRCMAQERTMGLIDQDMKAARALGASGTPFSVIVFSDNSYKTVSGALPYEQWKSLLESYEHQ